MRVASCEFMPVFLCAVRCARSSRSRLIYKRQWGTTLSPLCSGSATAPPQLPAGPPGRLSDLCLVSHTRTRDTSQCRVDCLRLQSGAGRTIRPRALTSRVTHIPTGMSNYESADYAVYGRTKNYYTRQETCETDTAISSHAASVVRVSVCTRCWLMLA